MIYFLLLQYFANCATLKDVSISIGNNTITALTTYQFNLKPITAISDTGYILITFPSLYTDLSQGNYECSLESDLTKKCTCSLIDFTMSITSCFPASPNLTFNLKISKIKNPSIAKTCPPFIINTYANTNSLADTHQTLTLKFTEGTLSNGKILLTGRVAEQSRWSLELNIGLKIPSGGFIFLETPLWTIPLGKSNSGSSSGKYCPGSILCKESQSLSTSLPCECNDSGVNITVTQELAGPVQIEISSLSNPASASSVFGFMIKTGLSDGFFEKSGNLSTSVPLPALLKVNRFLLNSAEVSRQTSYYFEIFTTSPIPQFSFIYLNFSSEFEVSASLTIAEIFGIYNSKVSVNNGKVLITNGFNSDYLLENSLIAFNLSFIRNPESSKESESISVSVFEKNNALVACVLTGLTVSAVPGKLTVKIEPSSWKVSERSIFTFTVILSHPVKQGGGVYVVFPDEISPADTEGRCLYVPDNSALDKTANCKVSGNKYLIVSNGFPAGNKTDSVVFQISDVLNSKSTSSTSKFLVSTCSTSACLYFIDSDSSFSLKFLPSVINSVIIEPAVKVTGEPTSLVFTLEVNSVIPQKAYIEVEFPATVKTEFKTCSGIFGISSDIRCFFNTLLNVTAGFETADFSSGKLSFSVSLVDNPKSTRPVSGIRVSIKLKGDLISLKNDCFFQASQPHALKSVSIQSTDLTVGSVSDIEVKIEVFNLVPLTWIFLKESNDLKLKTSGCSGTGVTGCLALSTGLNVTLDSQSQPVLSLKLSGLEMPKSTKPSKSLEIYTYESIYQVDFQNQSISLQMSTPDSLSSASISTSSPFINEASEYSFTLKNKNPVPSSGFVLILFPKEISLIDPTTCFYSQLPTTCSSTSEGLKVKVLNEVFSSFFTVSVKNVKNPGQTGSFSFKITTLTEESYLIDQLAGVAASFTCKGLCATCIGLASNCSSCIKSYFYDNSCHSTCLSGFYPSQSFECLKCDALCSTCQTFETCTSCLNFKVLNNGKCLDSCPVGFFNSSFICTKCQELCLKCDNSGCLECTSGYFIYHETCIKECPGYVKDAICLDCLTGCRTCENSKSCKACLTGFILYENSCLSSCPEGTYEALNSSTLSSFCLSCDPNCKSCSGQNNCQDCQGSFILHAGKCRPDCPSSYFNLNKTCQACGSNCLTCNSSQCFECLPGFLYYNGSCLASCPSSVTVAVSGKCEECQGTCLTCTGSPYSCTSCSFPLNLYQSACLAACPSPLIPYNSQCVECEGCLTCEDSPSNCSSCEEPFFLHKGQCLETCPEKVSVAVGRVCEKCSEVCLFCQNQTEFCTQCKTGLEYQGTCLETCPDGFFENNGKCLSFCAAGCSEEKLNNGLCDSECNYAECNYDNFSCTIATRYSSRLDVQSTPFPSTIASVSSTGVSGVSKFFVPATSFVSSSVSLMSITESASWVNLAYQISLVEYTHGRELLNAKQKTRLALALVIGFLVIHFLMNLVFVLVYYFQILSKDEKLKTWSKSHKVSNGIIVTFSCLVSFKFMKIIVSNIFGFKVCKADLDKKSTLLKPILIMSYISITTTSVPILCILVYILSVYSSGNPVFVFALDTLITTLICTLMMIPDIVFLHKEIQGEAAQVVMPEFLTTFEPDLNKNLKIETFSVYEVQDNDKTCMDTGRTLIQPSQLHETLGNDRPERVEISCQTAEEIFLSPRLKMLKKPSGLGNLENDFGREGVVNDCEKEINDCEKEINDCEKEIVGEFETGEEKKDSEDLKKSESNERKNSVENKEFEQNEKNQKFDHFDQNDENQKLNHFDHNEKNQIFDHFDQNEEPIELEEVVLNQVSRLRPSDGLNLSFVRVSYDSIFPTVKDPRPSEVISLSFERVSHESVSPTLKTEILTIESVNELQILPFRPVIIKDETSDYEIFDSSKEFIDDENEPQLLETIDEEDEIDLSNAEIDTFDLECIKVTHRASGLNVLVKKNFVNALVEDGGQVNDKNYSIEEIDAHDVRVGVLKRSNSDSFIKARRHFHGSTIVDVELRSGIWLVGRTVRSESDFAFDSARLCSGGRSVIVDHVLSGIPYMVSKTFVGAVSAEGEKLESDPQSLIVDEQDPHLGTFEGVLYRRSFVGGLVSAVLDEKDFEPYVADSRASDKTAFFDKNSSQSEFSVPADNSEFMSTFSDGFFVNKPSASIEIQTEIDYSQNSSLSLNKIDSISVAPLKIKRIQSVLQVDDPVSSQRKFKKFSKISEVNDSCTSSKSKLKSKKTRLKKRSSKQPSNHLQSKESSKQSTPKSKFHRSQRSRSSNSNDSRSSIEAIYLQRLRTPKDRGEKFPKSSSSLSSHQNSQFSMSIQQSLNQLHSMANPAGSFLPLSLVTLHSSDSQASTPISK